MLIGIVRDSGERSVCRLRSLSDDSDNELALVQTVEGNKLPYSKREIADAEGARDLFIKMGRPVRVRFSRSL